ncbi:MAG: hypothetical protein IPG69_07305 [Flavobacteriales bacterium]|nr:hypothetical protein [Flavobacteriales bacterium]
MASIALAVPAASSYIRCTRQQWHRLMRVRNGPGVAVFVSLAANLSAQVLPTARSTDWSKAGFQLSPPSSTITVDITTFGGIGDGVTANGAALFAAFTAVQGQAGVILFPPGDFLFTSTILLPDSVVLRGATADSTTLTFSLGGVGHCIAAIGQEEPQHFALSQNSARGDMHLSLASTVGIDVDDEIRLYRDDTALVVSPWALGTTGQLARVVSVDPDGVEIASALRAHYPLHAAPYFRKLAPVRHAGIECLRIVRTDATPPDEWSNIHFERASHCWVKGVESDRCNFAHVELFASTNCEVSGSYLHHAFAYGGGGQGYGVLAYFTAGENYIYDNIFEHLRHAMILQAGANGNVFAYNRSVDPYWTEGIFPPNSAGEIVLHGDHSYLNLFEGNIVQNIVIDDSHGSNGPFNTLFRNRAGGWGLIMNNAPATDSVNFVGNEILGSPGLYLPNGVGHFEYGNIVQGTVDPPGTGDLEDTTYYATSLPDFVQVIGGWPQVGPNSLPPGSISAAERYAAGTALTVCDGYDVGMNPAGAIDGTSVRCHPVPFDDHFMVEGLWERNGDIHLRLRNTLGAVVLERLWTRSASAVEVSGCGILPSGAYVLEVWDGRGRRAYLRTIKQ